MKNTHTLNIRNFPYDLNKAAKIKAIKQGISFRQFVIEAVERYIKAEKETA